LIHGEMKPNELINSSPQSHINHKVIKTCSKHWFPQPEHKEDNLDIKIPNQVK